MTYKPDAFRSDTHDSIACWYPAWVPYNGCPFRPSQRSSFRGTRTALACHEAIANAVGVVNGCDEYPQPSSHAYSVLGTSTPSTRIVWPSPLTKWLPEIAIDKAGLAFAG